MYRPHQIIHVHELGPKRLIRPLHKCLIIHQQIINQLSLVTEEYVN